MGFYFTVLDKPNKLVEGKQRQPGVEQNKEENGGDNREYLPRHFRSEYAGAKAQNGFKQNLHQPLQATGDDASLPGGEKKKEDDNQGGEPGGNEGVGYGELGGAQRSEMSLFPPAFPSVFSFRQAEGFIARGCRKNRLGRQVDFRLLQELFGPEHGRPNCPKNETHQHQHRQAYACKKQKLFRPGTRWH